jgi:hypothetical protein
MSEPNPEGLLTPDQEQDLGTSSESYEDMFNAAKQQAREERGDALADGTGPIQDKDEAWRIAKSVEGVMSRSLDHEDRAIRAEINTALYDAQGRERRADIELPDIAASQERARFGFGLAGEVSREEQRDIRREKEKDLDRAS